MKRLANSLWIYFQIPMVLKTMKFLQFLLHNKCLFSKTVLKKKEILKRKSCKPTKIARNKNQINMQFNSNKMKKKIKIIIPSNKNNIIIKMKKQIITPNFHFKKIMIRLKILYIIMRSSINIKILRK